ncbi:LOW QUALITY PROTEIN: hypothetical protein HID58_067180 [Brassica napus]|uniref:Uncharacterized protein n=1 Tax=Brassica napus TaxID=3708 RepID=A0ABQ7ZIC4_BRANA|nr:LOW QUALITY PROTEIN: hypothetical protein HID58_067180 [Brassica napus]
MSHHPCKQWSFNTDAQSAFTIAKRIQTILVEKTKHTCLRLELSGADTIYGKGTWHHCRFVISFIDGSPLGFANCNGKNPLTSHRHWLSRRPRRSGGASGAGTNRYRGISNSPSRFKQPDSVYSFSDVLERCKQEEVASKARYFDKMKSEAENCSLTQGDKLCNEKKWSLRVQLIQRHVLHCLN